MNPELASKVLVVGPQYKNHRGGIGAVIDSYSKCVKPFNFVSTYKPLSKYLVPLYSLKQIIILCMYLFKNPSIKIVHIHGASRGSFFRKYIIFLFSKYIFNKKTIYHIHGAEFHIFYENSNLITKNLVKNIFEHTDKVICLSTWWCSYFLKHFNPKSISVLPNIIEKIDSQKKDNHNNKRIIFLFLGRVGKRKGIYDLIDVISSLAKLNTPPFEVWIGGDGEIDILEKIIAKEGLHQLVKYLGWVTGEKKREVLAKADVYVLPSYNEGLPVSILEAMNYELPIISTNVGGISELVKPHKNGFLINPGDKDALQEAMLYFLNNSDKVAKFGGESKQMIKSYYPEKVVDQLGDFYKELL
ncbi:glycosyltransferase family 4 protein [Pontibacter harenae]|uniref:glycosyltransferase family 4 protein n=1 Tax=Pontibacter harenae TaxID=2894083 RepID=UPI001E28FCF9|nr:glycosyltransferase family 4 protein [Pontibacter harenae]MCC9166157.1 glycosyltransferase family 4 protein [Pontibacter harenae]